MDIKALKDEFYDGIAKALIDFSNSEKNKDVYVMVLDCDSDVGMASLRYHNRCMFESELERYKVYEEKHGWKVYGLHGSEYDPGEFAFIEYEKSALVEHFFDSYYYHKIGNYYGEGEPIEEIKDNYKEIFWEVIIDTINRLKIEMEELGVHITEDFIFFHCDHDQNYEERDRMIAMTVDEDVMKKLIERK